MSLSVLLILLILLIALGPWPVVAGQETGDSSCAAASEDSSITANGCCDEQPDHNRQLPCGHSHCPASPCSPLSFVPMSNNPVHFLQTLENETFFIGGYASHLSTPSTPPPIVRRLS